MAVLAVSALLERRQRIPLQTFKDLTTWRRLHKHKLRAHVPQGLRGGKERGCGLSAVRIRSRDGVDHANHVTRGGIDDGRAAEAAGNLRTLRQLKNWMP